MRVPSLATPRLKQKRDPSLSSARGRVTAGCHPFVASFTSCFIDSHTRHLVNRQQRLPHESLTHSPHAVSGSWGIWQQPLSSIWEELPQFPYEMKPRPPFDLSVLRWTEDPESSRGTSSRPRARRTAGSTPSHFEGSRGSLQVERSPAEPNQGVRGLTAALTMVNHLVSQSIAPICATIRCGWHRVCSVQTLDSRGDRTRRR